MPHGESAGPLLQVLGVTKRFPGVTALDGVSLDCHPGEVLALVGENGAGKSTLVKILAGAYSADDGRIRFAGTEYQSLRPELTRRIGIGVIHQEFNLVPGLTAVENMFLGTELRTRFGDLSLRSMSERARQALARLGASLPLNVPVVYLTVAEQQLVEIAKALLLDARLIVMDEPSSVLAGTELDRLLAVVKSLKEHGVAVIYVSHRLAEVFQISDRVTVLKDGRLMGTRRTAGIDADSLIRMMIGRPLTASFPMAQTSPGRTVLKVRNLRVGKLLEDVSFDLHEREILGLGGLVGSGRTTLARTLFGLEPYAGEVEILGRRRRFRGPASAVGEGVILVPEDRQGAGLVPGKSVRFNLSLPNLRKLSRAGLVRAAAEAALVGKLIESVRLRSSDALRDVTYLSGGNQQKVVLGKWLARLPQVAILDEPTRGIDVGAKMEIHQQMRRIADQGSALIMITSDLLELLGMSDRILVFSAGRLSGELPRERASEEAVMRLAVAHQPTMAEAV